MQKKSKAVLLIFILLFALLLATSGCMNDVTIPPKVEDGETATSECDDFLSVEPITQEEKDYQLIYVLVEGSQKYQQSAIPSINLIREIIKEVIQPGDILTASWVEPDLYKDAVFLQIAPAPLPIPKVLHTPTPLANYFALMTAESVGTSTPIPTHPARLERMKQEQEATKLAYEESVQATRVILSRNCQIKAFQESYGATATEFVDKYNKASNNIIATSESQLIMVTPGQQPNGSHLVEAVAKSVKAINNNCEENDGRKCHPKLIIFSDFDDYRIKEPPSVDLSGIDVYQVMWNCPFLDVDDSLCAKYARSWQDYLSAGQANVTLINGDTQQFELIEKLKVR